MPVLSETTLRVRYAETDAMGIVHHAVYPVWMELGRSDLLRSMGQGYAEWEAQGYMMAVSSIELTYRAPARYDELVTVRTRVAEVRTRQTRFAYEVVGPAGQRLAVGETTHVCTDRAGRVTSLPASLRDLLSSG